MGHNGKAKRRNRRKSRRHLSKFETGEQPRRSIHRPRLVMSCWQSNDGRDADYEETENKPRVKGSRHLARLRKNCVVLDDLDDFEGDGCVVLDDISSDSDEVPPPKPKIRAINPGFGKPTKVVRQAD